MPRCRAQYDKKREQARAAPGEDAHHDALQAANIVQTMGTTGGIGPGAALPDAVDTRGDDAGIGRVRAAVQRLPCDHGDAFVTWQQDEIVPRVRQAKARSAKFGEKTGQLRTTRER